MDSYGWYSWYGWFTQGVAMAIAMAPSLKLQRSDHGPQRLKLFRWPGRPVSWAIEKKWPEGKRWKRLRYQATIHAKKRTKYSNIPIYVRAGGQIQDANISADFRIRPVVARIVWKAFRRF